MAGLCLLAVTLSGAYNAWVQIPTISALWTTGYGEVLIVKTGLLGALVSIGWVNRYRLIPRRALQELRLSVAAELVLFACLAGAVALLTDLRPGHDRVAAARVSLSTGPPPLPAKEMVVQAQEGGRNAVALAARPPGAEVFVLDPDGRGVNGLSVRIGGVTTRPCGSGCYGATVAAAGRVIVSVGGRKLAFVVPAKARPAGRLVARATKAFRALRSVDYVERLASDPRNRVVADFTLERPNRLEYRIRGGASGIIIGPRRWDRARGGRWLSSPQDPTPQPEPIWAGHFTNAFLLETTPSTYVVAFMRSVGPVWFTLRLDRRTLLPRDLQMAAAAHFMTHRYKRFNAPRRIKPPTS